MNENILVEMVFFMSCVNCTFAKNIVLHYIKKDDTKFEILTSGSLN